MPRNPFWVLIFLVSKWEQNLGRIFFPTTVWESRVTSILLGEGAEHLNTLLVHTTYMHTRTHAHTHTHRDIHTRTHTCTHTPFPAYGC